jgi:hypothetical protein
MISTDISTIEWLYFDRDPTSKMREFSGFLRALRASLPSGRD